MIATGANDNGSCERTQRDIPFMTNLNGVIWTRKENGYQRHGVPGVVVLLLALQVNSSFHLLPVIFRYRRFSFLPPFFVLNCATAGSD